MEEYEDTMRELLEDLGVSKAKINKLVKAVKSGKYSDEEIVEMTADLF